LDGLRRVVHAGGDRDRDGRDHGQHNQDVEPREVVGPGRGQEVAADGDHLCHGLGFAGLRRGYHLVADHGHADQRDAQLAAQDHAGHPPGQLALQRKADQRGADQRFVSDRVGDLPEGRHQAPAAREVPVCFVGHGGH
jgi:hypothetical protein